MTNIDEIYKKVQKDPHQIALWLKTKGFRDEPIYRAISEFADLIPKDDTLVGSKLSQEILRRCSEISKSIALDKIEEDKTEIRELDIKNLSREIQALANDVETVRKFIDKKIILRVDVKYSFWEKIWNFLNMRIF